MGLRVLAIGECLLDDLFHDILIFNFRFRRDQKEIVYEPGGGSVGGLRGEY